jgi:hypothetical protein
MKNLFKRLIGIVEMPAGVVELSENAMESLSGCGGFAPAAAAPAAAAPCCCCQPCCCQPCCFNNWRNRQCCREDCNLDFNVNRNFGFGF